MSIVSHILIILSNMCLWREQCGYAVYTLLGILGCFGGVSSRYLISFVLSLWQSLLCRGVHQREDAVGAIEGNHLPFGGKQGDIL